MNSETLHDKPKIEIRGNGEDIGVFKLYPFIFLLICSYKQMWANNYNVWMPIKVSSSVQIKLNLQITVEITIGQFTSLQRGLLPQSEVY